MPTTTKSIGVIRDKRVRWVTVTVLIAVGVSVALALTSPNGSDYPARQLGAADAADAVATTTPCWPSEIPKGALPGQPAPIWCYTNLVTNVPDTHKSGPNDWADEFNHGVSLGRFEDGDGGYRIFNTQGKVYKTQHWRHADHWMMDMAPLSPNGEGLLGGGMMRPNRAFQFEDRKLVVEADVAAGIAAYGEQSNAWTEMVITNAPEPTGKILTELYTYGQFGGYWSFGCRLAHDGTITCALYNPDGTPGNPQYNGTDDGRVFEMSWFQHVGSHIYNGQFDPVAKDPLRKCQNTDPDTNCRDRFRLELTKSSVTIYVNGIKYFEQSDLPAEVQFPDAMINNDVYVYFSGWQVRQDATPIRFHWDRLAVNPKDAHGKLLPPSAIQEGHSAHHEP